VSSSIRRKPPKVIKQNLGFLNEKLFAISGQFAFKTATVPLVEYTSEATRKKKNFFKKGCHLFRQTSPALAANETGQKCAKK